MGIPIDNLLHSSLPEELVLKRKDNRYPKEETPKDWEKYDSEMAPILDKVAYDIYHGNINDTGRPERVSERLIYKYAGLANHRLDNMPKCCRVLSKYKESYAQNWARRLVWAYKKVKADKVDKPVFWCDIRKISGVKKKNADVITPFLEQYADKSTADAIKSLLNL